MADGEAKHEPRSRGRKPEEMAQLVRDEIPRNKDGKREKKQVGAENGLNLQYWRFPVA
jgi:hypothetical protein